MELMWKPHGHCSDTTNSHTSHKEDTVDWNDQKYCEIWRHEWEVIQNRYLEANDRPERVDLRSYARQGLDIVPTVYEKYRKIFF